MIPAGVWHSIVEETETSWLVKLSSPPPNTISTPAWVPKSSYILGNDGILYEK